MKGGSSHIFRGGVFHFGTGWKGLGWWYPPPPTLQHHNFNGDTREPGFRDKKGQQAISEKRRMGIRGVQLRSRIGQVHGGSRPLRLRKRVPCESKGQGLHLPSVPEALKRGKSGFECQRNPSRTAIY